MEELRELNNEIGEYLEESTRKALKVLGYSVFKHRVNQSGIDVLGVARDNKTFIAIECLNWCHWSYANAERLRSLANNFNKYPNTVKILLTSFDVLTRRQKKLLRNIGVINVEIGEQVLASGKIEIVKILNVIYDKISNDAVLSLLPKNSRDEFLTMILILNGYPELVQKEEESIEVGANTLQLIETEEPKPSSLDDSVNSMDNVPRRVILMVNHEIMECSHSSVSCQSSFYSWFQEQGLYSI